MGYVKFKGGMSHLALLTSVALLFGAAFMRVHMRVETTLMGYEIGHLKTREARLLQDRAQLTMQLAKLTTKQHLSMMVAGDDANANALGDLAAK